MNNATKNPLIEKSEKFFINSSANGNKTALKRDPLENQWNGMNNKYKIMVTAELDEATPNRSGVFPDAFPVGFNVNDISDRCSKAGNWQRYRSSCRKFLSKLQQIEQIDGGGEEHIRVGRNKYKRLVENRVGVA